MMKMDQIGHYQIINLSTGRLESFKELCSKGPCVIIFFRRWGCIFSRVWAKELSEIAPILKSNNIRLIGIGRDENGKQDFIKGKFFDGEIYQDYLKQTFTGMKFKRSNYFHLLGTLIFSESRAARSKGSQMKLGGDCKGDKFQNGGLLISDNKGEIIYEFRQQRPSHFLSNDEIIKIVLDDSIKENMRLDETRINENNTDDNISNESNSSIKEIGENIENIPKNDLLNRVDVKEDLDKIEKMELQHVS